MLAEHTSHTVYPTSEYFIYDLMFFSGLPDFKVGNIYSWSRFTPLNEVKVVILGQVSFLFSSNAILIEFLFPQDPYHDVGQAHGTFKTLSHLAV